MVTTTKHHLSLACFATRNICFKHRISTLMLAVPRVKIFHHYMNIRKTRLNQIQLTTGQNSKKKRKTKNENRRENCCVLAPNQSRALATKFSMFSFTLTHAHTLFFFFLLLGMGERAAQSVRPFPLANDDCSAAEAASNEGDPLKLPVHGILLGFATVNCLYTAIQDRGCKGELVTKEAFSN